MIKENAGPPATTHILFSRTKEGTAAAKVFEKGFDAIVSKGIYRGIIERHLDLYLEIDRDQILRDLRTVGLLGVVP